MATTLHFTTATLNGFGESGRMPADSFQQATKDKAANNLDFWKPEWLIVIGVCPQRLGMMPSGSLKPLGQIFEETVTAAGYDSLFVAL